MMTSQFHAIMISLPSKLKRAFGFKKLFLSILFILSSISLSVAFEGPNPYGAGLAGMNGSIVALRREDAVSYNPAVIPLLDRKSLLLSGTQSFGQKQNMQAFGIWPAKQMGLGFGFSRTTVGGIELKDELNRSLGSTDFYSQKIGFYGGTHLGKNLAIGTGINLSSYGLGSDTFDSKALFDLGLMGGAYGWMGGGSILRWGEGKSSEVRFGIAREGKLTYAMESVWALSGNAYGLFSIEYHWHDLFEPRFVYHTGPQDLDRFGIISGFSFGFRINYFGTALDYAVVPEGDLGFSHKFSIVFKGKKKVERNWRLEPLFEDQEKNIYLARALKPAHAANAVENKTNEAVPAPYLQKHDQVVSAASSRENGADASSSSSMPPVVPTSAVSRGDEVCPAEMPVLYEGELGKYAAASAEFNERISALKHEVENIKMGELDPYAYGLLQSNIDDAVRLADKTGNAVSGFSKLSSAENRLAQFRNGRKSQIAARATTPEKKEQWSAFCQESKNYFAVLAREVEITENKEALNFNLKNVSCIGSGRFSIQSATILVQIAKFLKKHTDYPLLIQISGAKEDSDCAEGIRTFLYNEKLDSKMKTQFSIGEQSTHLIVLRNAESEPAQEKSQEPVEVISNLTIFFEKGEQAVPQEYQELVRNFGGMIKDQPGLSVVVRGFTDIKGDPDYRKLLALCHARKVERLLLDSGIPSHVVAVNASGNEWVASNDTPEGRARNRRVDITFRYLENR